MIELGKQNFVGRAQLDIDLFAGNRSFIGVDTMALQDLYQEYAPRQAKKEVLSLLTFD
jgi:hypothetical protein